MKLKNYVLKLLLLSLILTLSSCNSTTSLSNSTSSIAAESSQTEIFISTADSSETSQSSSQDYISTDGEVSDTFSEVPSEEPSIDVSIDTSIEESKDISSESSEEMSEESSEETSEESSEDTSTVQGGFSEPEGSTHKSENNASFETNCQDEGALKIMGEIADIASKYNKVTVYYTDVSQKYYFAFGADLIHNTASTIKAPYAAYILKSGADLSEVLTMEKRHVQGGSGVIKNKEVGTEFTVSELIRYMITRSDNTAYEMLLERYGTKGFKEYSSDLGIDFKLPSGGYTTCTIREMATYLLDIYQYRDTERGKTLIKHMKNCSYSLQIPKAVSHSVAHKFGFIYEGKAFHDMGIVYAPSPYIELIFTRIDGTVYDTKAFLEIGKKVEELNQYLSEEY